MTRSTFDLEFIPGRDGYDVLPPGRHACSFEAFRHRFVESRTVDRARREQIIADFIEYRNQQVRTGLVVDSYWIDGSFTSDKMDPGDIDITAVIDGAASQPIGGHGDWVNPRDRWKTEVHPAVGRTLLVDGYAIVKVPDGAPPEYLAEYRQLRGYWDDWWQRSRATQEETVKGYVEVRF